MCAHDPYLKRLAFGRALCAELSANGHKLVLLLHSTLSSVSAVEGENDRADFWCDPLALVIDHNCIPLHVTFVKCVSLSWEKHDLMTRK